MDHPDVAIVPPELDANAVISRIEAAMEHFVSSLADGDVPVMGGGGGEGAAEDVGAPTPATAANANTSQQLGRRSARTAPQPGSRSLLASQGAGALAYARGELVSLRAETTVCCIQGLVVADRQLTQRPPNAVGDCPSRAKVP